MVRKSLKRIYNPEQNAPHTFTGRLSEVSLDRHRDGYKVLVNDVCLTTGEWITDHLWITFDVFPYTMGLNFGDSIQFSGTIENYERRDGSMDFGIITIPETIRRSDSGIVSPVL